MAAKLETTRHPGIYRRGSRYVVIWRHKGRQRKTSYGTLAEAREAKGRADAGESRPASRERFHDYAEQWLQTYQGRTVRGVGSRTMSGYRRCLELYALPYFQGYKLAEIEPPDAREFVRHLEGKGLRPSTTRGVLAPLRAMFATAVEDRALRQNPTIGVRVSGRRDAPLFFELLAHSGLRISEAIGLTWDQVEFGNRPRLLVRQQDCRGQVGELSPTTPAGTCRSPPAWHDGYGRRRANRARGCSRRSPALRSRTGTSGGGCSSLRARSRSRVGHVPQLPANLRLAAVRRWKSPGSTHNREVDGSSQLSQSPLP